MTFIMLGSYVWRILVVIIVCLVLANPLFVSQYYTSVEDLDDTIGDEALIKNCSSPSLTTCASRCHDACTCFAYNSKDNRCDLLEKCSGALPTRTENGWHYFRKTEDICRQPQNKGMCRALHKRWWYNHLTNHCEEFIYSGCQGNENNFKTEEECKQRC
ncbi:tissue factor pathway inhibitor-like [Ostrea edulis]|uniref:tissue factor pathway inhibitor-like n=1 Tax=Ostrea edulis TaxID=37623 RepID=UPI0024AEDDB2|nr:tissue factor pathway inhibitor-like [Ostrea edulis]